MMKTNRNFHSRGGLLALLAILCATGTPAGADTRDLAELMPRDTLVYVGWAQLADKDERTPALMKAVLQSPLFGQSSTAETAGFSKIFEVAGLVFRGSGGVGLLGVETDQGRPDVQIALVVDAGGESSKLAAAMQDLVKLLDGKPLGEAALNGVTLQQARVPDLPAPLVWGAHKNKFFAALGPNAARKIIDRLNGQGQSLLDNDEFKADRAKVKPAADGPLFCVFANAAAGLETVKKIVGPPPPQGAAALDALGVNSLRSIYLHMDGREPNATTRFFVHIKGPYNGFLKWWEQKPLTDDDLKIIPKDAYWAQTWNLDLAALWRETLNVVEKVEPADKPAVEGVPAAAAKVLGFSLTEDLLPALGDTWAVYDAPEHGGMLLTGTVLVVDARDAKALDGILRRIIEMAAPFASQAKMKLLVKEMKHGPHTIQYVAFGGYPVPVAPAWGFVGDRWVFGLFPQTVAAAMNQVDPKTRKDSILDHPDVQAARKTLPREIQSFGYEDSRYTLRQLYPLMRFIETAVLSTAAGAKLAPALEAQLDARRLGTPSEMLEGVRNHVGVCSVDQDGALYISSGSGVPMLGAALTSYVAMSASILMPALWRARAQAERVSSAVNLRMIGQACHMYAMENRDEKMPPTLDDLAQYGISPEILRSPLNKTPETSYIYITGHTLRKSRNPAQDILAYERVYEAEQEGTHALLLDGHVEYMKLDRFKQALRDTYKRLDRENEMPADLKP